MKYKYCYQNFCIYIFLIVFIIGCSMSAIYRAPKDESLITDYSRTISKSFDETWKALINYSAGTFFGIENFEKESGLITLIFGASNPEDYITGGYWKYDYQWGANKIQFEGDYVEYSSIYLNGSLNGKMNIVVNEIDSNKTQVTVNARYVFDQNYTDKNGRNYSNTWVFNSGECSTVNISNPSKGTPPTRTICPTYLAETSVLEAIESIQ